MIWRKTCCIQSGDSIIQVFLIEIADSNGQSIFTWPCAIALALYLIAYPEVVADKLLIELGAGNALPSMVAGKLGCRSLVVSDRDDGEVQSLIKHSIVANELQDKALAVPLNWGSSSSSVYDTPFDVILGADVFYSSEDFDAVLLSVYRLLTTNPSAIFLTTYQERRRTLRPYLDKYGMSAEVIPAESYVNSFHNGTSDGVITVTVGDSPEQQKEISVPQVNHIQLLKIRLRV